MKGEFVPPEFATGSLEIRVMDDEVCIYGTCEGLMWLGNACLKLAKKGKVDHMHLEDYQRMTRGSVMCVLAVFPEKGAKSGQ